jgi:hypothetical protein
VSAYLIFARDKTLGEHRFKGASYRVTLVPGV